MNASKIEITGNYDADLKAAIDLGLVDKKPGKMISKIKLHEIMNEYNNSFIDESIGSSIDEYTTIWKAPINDESDAIEIARSQLTEMMKGEPIATKPTALDQAIASLPSDLALALQKQFEDMQAASSSKKPKASGKKVDPAIKLGENLAKYGEIYRLVTDLISNGKTRSLAETLVAGQFETSQGRVHHWCVGYHLYSHYPEIQAAVDSGSYKLSELILNGLNRDRSALISEKLGIEIQVDIQF
jgi:hypothetical protein